MSLTGDIRLTPFYDVEECVAKVQGYVDELNKGKTLYSLLLSGLVYWYTINSGC